MSASTKPKLVRSSAIFFGLSNLAAFTLVPLWGWLYGYSLAAWISFVVLLMLGGMSVTTGYHRLWSHRTFKARWPARLFFAIFGGMALQNSVYIWAARHRVHHRHVDEVDRDPHSIKSGFWHAHIGWMLRAWPTSEVDFSEVKDLEKDWVVMLQHRFYWPLVWLSNLGIPLLLGVIFNEVIGMLLLAGVLRLVVSHHFTFFINSLAHTWGRRPYSDENTAVDNGWIALLTWGEGYHNYHHAFQADYRNGVRWWQYDPSKWLINAMAWTGMAFDRKRMPNFRIQRAKLAMEFQRLNQRLNQQVSAHCTSHKRWRELLDREYHQFRETIAAWQAVQMRKLEAGTESLRDRWVKTELRCAMKELDYRLKMQRKRLRVLTQRLEPLPA